MEPKITKEEFKALFGEDPEDMLGLDWEKVLEVLFEETINGE